MVVVCCIDTWMAQARLYITASVGKRQAAKSQLEILLLLFLIISSVSMGGYSNMKRQGGLDSRLQNDVRTAQLVI